MDEDRAHLRHHRAAGVTTGALTPAEVRDLTAGGGEYALLDLREEGAFSEKRLLLASCLPLSRLELRCHLLVPRRSTRVVVMDGGDGDLAWIGQTRLRAAGYEDVRLMTGGVAAWEAVGLPVYSGVNVLTKAFGEVVHTHCGTPDISAEELKAWIDEGQNLAILDSRPFHEYQHHTIPGAISVPGAELVAQVARIVPDPETTIVVNCAGRTRSIIGCQSLINAGVPNRIHALRNGTMGWKLAGFRLEEGASRSWEQYGPPDLEPMKLRASGLADRYGVATMTLDQLVQMGEDPLRTIYLFDVRTPEDFAAGHIPGASNAPGGQLVQALDDYVGVRNAVIVLTDPMQIRAVTTASWLRQIGQCEVYVLSDPPAPTEAGESRAPGPLLPDIPQMNAATLAGRLERGGVCVLDLSTSVEHRSGHVPGAFWYLRGREDALSDVARDAEVFVLSGPDTSLLQLSGSEIIKTTAKRTFLLDGGIEAWRAAGHLVETGMQRPVGTINDVWYKPYEIEDSKVERAMANGYLSWEVDLAKKISADIINFCPFMVNNRSCS